ncbi:hypothetical protein H8A97_26300 [Bradyrhizobium sp. Arg62]|uniref:hypothetical protein n=1 Tax=Bradyrhizobium brasilense TaxID=1419277 RepID=UPI001E441BEE|nr:hypothetical protein [Bradyrhizobium brasilense]MCC8948528.1 hypothetical protein [Bradyrhizobium brasilense]
MLKPAMAGDSCKSRASVQARRMRAKGTSCLVSSWQLASRHHRTKTVDVQEARERLPPVRGVATAEPPSEDGSVFGQLTLADQLTGFYPVMALTDASRQDYQSMFSALLDAGQREVISDYPRFFAEKAEDPEEPVLEPLGQNAPVVQPAARAAEPSVETFPDEFVREFVRRARWIQEDLADGLIEHFVRDREIREDFLRRGYRVRDEIVSRARLEALRDVPWLDAGGAKITHLRYPIRQFLGSAPSHEWPSSDIRTLPMALGVLQGGNLGIVNLCTGA